MERYVAQVLSLIRSIMRRRRIFSVRFTTVAKYVCTAAIILVLALPLFVKPTPALAGSQTFTATNSWQVPAGVTSVTITMRGGGAPGGIGSAAQSARGGGGGGGGAYTKCTITVTPLSSYTVTVGAEKTTGTNGNPSSFIGDNGTCTANGGLTGTNNTGGAGGTAQTVSGVVIAAYAGGPGGNGVNATNGGGGGGGEAARSTATGGTGTAGSGSTGGAGGTGGDGADGGRGGDSSNSPTGVVAGSAPGGGGGGAGGNVDTVGAGARGEVLIEWVDPPSLTLSGTLYSDEGVTAITGGRTIMAAVGTSTVSIHQTTSDGSGNWSITLPSGQSVGTSTPIVVWVDNDATTRAVTFTKASSTNTTISGVNLYQNRVIVRHEATSGTSTTIANMSFYDGDDDTNIQYTANGSTLSVRAGNELHIAAGKAFTASGTVEVRGNAGSGVDGSLHLASNSVYAPSGTTTLAGNLFASSTARYYPNPNGFLFNATTTGKTINAFGHDLGRVTFNGSGGGWTFATSATTTALTVTSGSVTAPASGQLTVRGAFTQNDTFANTTGTLVAQGHSATFSGTMTGTNALGSVTVQEGASPASMIAYDTAQTEIYALAVDSENQVLYAGATAGILYRCALSSGCDAAGDFSSPLDTAYSLINSLAIDTVNDVLYVGDGGAAGNIYRCALSSGCDESGDFSAVYNTTQFSVRALTIDPVRGMLFVGTASAGNIYRCALSTGCDASGDFALAYATGEDEVLSLEVDTTYGVLYVGTGANGIIYRCVLSTGCDASGDYATAFDSAETYIFSLVADERSGALYAGTAGSGIIYRCVLATGCNDSGDFATVLDTTEVRIRSLAVDGDTNTLYAGTGDSGLVYQCRIATDCDATEDFSVATDTVETNIFSLVSAHGSLYAGGGDVNGMIFKHTPQGAYSLTIANNASTTHLTVGTNATVTAPTQLSISGSYTNSGVFIAGTGTTTFSGTSAQTIAGTATGSSAFNGVVLNGAGEKTFTTNASTTNIYLESTATTTFSAPLTVSGTLKATTPAAKLALPANATATIAYLEMMGTSGNEVRLRSSTPGTQAGLLVTGTTSLTYVDVKDSAGSTTDGSLINADDGTSIDSGNNTGWTFGIPAEPGTALTISGILYTDRGITAGAAGKSVTLYAATSTPSTHSTTTGAGGVFSFSIDVNHTIGTATPLTIYVDGDASLKAILVTKAASSTANIASLPLYQNRLIIKNESTGATSTTIGDLALYDYDNDTDLPYTANSGVLSVQSGTELLIWQGTQFYASGTVTINGNAGTSTDGSLYVAGTYIPAATTTVAGNLYFATSSSYTPNPQGIVLNATTSGKYIHHYQATNTPNLGNLTFTGQGGSWEFGTDHATTSNLTINPYATVTAPLGTLNIKGNFTQNGEFNNNSGTIIADGYESTFTGTLSGTSSLASVALRDSAAESFSTAYDTSESYINSLTIDTANGVLYAGSGTGGIIYRCLLSTGCDAAGDFTTAYDTTQSIIYSLTIDTQNGVLYAGTGNGGIIYRCLLSTGCDAAGDFTTAYDTPESSILSLTIDSTNGVLYAGSGTGGIIYRCLLSTGCDAAGDFTTAYDTTQSNIRSLTIDSTNGVLYAGSGSGGIIYRCLLSTGCDAADDFTTAYDTTESYINSLTIDTTNGTLYAGTSFGGIIYRCALSTGCDAAGDFTTAYGTTESYINSLTIDTANGVLYAGSGSGGIIYRCALSTGCDAAGDFTTAYDTPESYIYSLTIDTQNGVLYAGTGNGGIIYRYIPSGVDSVTLGVNASTTHFTVGTYATATMATGTALEVTGTFENAGRFAAGAGTLYLTGASTTVTGTLTGSSSLSHVMVDGPDRFGTTSTTTFYGAAVGDKTSGDDRARGIAHDDEYVYVGGSISTGAISHHLIKYRKSDGEQVWATTTNVNVSTSDGIYDVEVDDGYIYTAGYRSGGGVLGGYAWHVIKYSKADGAQVWATTTDPSVDDDYAQSVVVDASYVYVAGYCTGCGSLGSVAYHVVAYDKSTGVAAWSTTTDPTASSDIAYSLSQDAEHLYVIGACTGCGPKGAGAGYTMKMSKLNGSRVWATSTDTTGGAETVYGGAADGDAVYVTGFCNGCGGGSGYVYRTEKLRKTDGIVIWTVTNDPSVGNDGSNQVAVDGEYVYVTGGCASCGTVGSTAWYTVALSKQTGSTVWATTIDPAAGADTPEDIVVDANYVYVSGICDGCGDVGGESFFTVKYDKYSGAMVGGNNTARFASNASTTGNLYIANGGANATNTLIAPAGSLTIAGNYTNYDTFVHSSGTIYFASSSAQVLAGNMATTSPFNDVVFSGAGVKSFADMFTVATDTTEISIYSFVIDTQNGVLYAGSGTGGIIYRCLLSTGCDAAGDFTTAYDTPESYINSLTIDTANGVLYAGTGDSGIIYRCLLSTGCDAAGDFTTAYDTTQSIIYSLTIDTANGVLYAGTGNGGIIYRCLLSTGCDASGDFTTAYDTAESSIYSLTIDTQNGVLYAGSGDSGIIYRCETGSGCVVPTNVTTLTDLTTESGSTLITPESVTIRGSYTQNGTTTATSTNTFFFTGSDTQTLSGALTGTSSLPRVVLSGSGAKTFAANASTTNDLTIESGAAVTAPAALTVGGNFTQGGTFAHNSGTLYLTGLGTAATGTLTSSNQLGSTSVSNTIGVEVYTTAYDMTQSIIYSLTIDTQNGVLYAGTGNGGIIYRRAGGPIFGANASTTNLTIEAGKSVTAPAQLSISGNYTNSGAFVAGSGTTTFSGSSAQTIAGTATGSSAFTGLVMTGAGEKTFTTNASTTNLYLESTATTTFSAPLTVSGTLKATTPSAKLALPANATATIAYLEMTGTSGNEVRLRSSTPGTQAGLLVTGTTSLTYVDVKDSNGSTTNGTLINGTGTGIIDSGNNTGWIFLEAQAGDATISSGANQTFALNYPTTTIATITVTDDVSPSITTTTGIRITIATTSVNMRWDTEDTTATFGGTASTKVSNPVTYENEGATLLITVTENFAASDTLTIDNLSFAQFLSTTTATSALGISITGNATGTLPTDDKTITITGSLTADNHATGQVDDNFQFPNQTQVSLYRYLLTPAGEQMTVSTTIFTLQGVNGVNQSDLTNTALYRDIDNDGELTGSDVQVGGAGTVAISGQTGTITFSTPYAATTTLAYLLVGDITAIRPGDMLTISLDPTDLEVGGDQTFGTVPPVGSVKRIQHLKGGLGAASGPVGGDAPEGQGVQTGGGQQGGGEIDTNTNGDTLGDLPGFKAPTSASTWWSAMSAIDSDGQYATTSTGGVQLIASSFNFDVPGTNQIAGIEVKVEASAVPAGGNVMIQLVHNGAFGVAPTSYSSSELTTTDTVYTFGGPSSTWGRSWTPSELSNANFRLWITSFVSANELQVDAIRVRVYHQATGGSQGGGVEVSRPADRFFAYAPVGQVAGAATTRDLYEAEVALRYALDMLEEVLRDMQQKGIERK